MNHLNRCKTSTCHCHRLLLFRFQWWFHHFMQGGNLMFAADCPTKRAAFMTDIDPGRWIDVPAFSIFRHGTGLSQEPYRNHLYYSILFQQEPSLDSFNRNHRSTVFTGTIARLSLFCSSIEDPCSVTAICILKFPTVLFDIQSELSIHVSAWELSICC